MLQPKLVSVEPMPGAKLHLCYETGEKKIFDVTPYIVGSWFGCLKNADYFRTVRSCTAPTASCWLRMNYMNYLSFAEKTECLEALRFYISFFRIP